MLLAMQDIILATREKEVRNHDYGSNHRPSLQPTMSSSQSAKFARKIKNTVGKIRIYILVSFPSSYKLIKLQLRVRNGKTFSPKNKKSKISPDQFPRCYVLLSSEEKKRKKKRETTRFVLLSSHSQKPRVPSQWETALFLYYQRSMATTSHLSLVRSNKSC